METFDLNSLESLATLWVLYEGNVLQQQTIEEKLRPMIEANKRFTREFLFELKCVKKNVIGINFIPTSTAYEDYGSSVTVIELLEVEEIRKNYESKINTTGYIKASGFLTKGVENEIIEISFRTNDILEIEHI